MMCAELIWGGISSTGYASDTYLSNYRMAQTIEWLPAILLLCQLFCIIGRAKRTHLGNIIKALSVSPDTVIASKCFYAFLFRHLRGEKYRNTMLGLTHNAEAFV